MIVSSASASPMCARSCAARSTKSVEFGSKLSVSLNDAGLARVDHLRWEALHEGLDLESQVAAYYERTGYYPESVLGDMIYRMRENRRYFSRLGIKFAGKPSERPGKVTEANQEELKQLKPPRQEEYCSAFRLKGNSVEVRTGIGSIISGRSGQTHPVPVPTASSW